MHVTELAVYPVKSLRGVSPREAEVELHGLRHDRRWMVVDAAGDKVRLEHHPRLLSVTARPTAHRGLELVRGEDVVPVAPPVDGEAVPVSLSRVGTARLAAPAAHALLSDVVGRPVRLVWLEDPTRRSVSPSHGGRPGEVLSLADTAPLLLTTVPSLRRLEQWGRERYVERYAACARDAGPRPAPLAMERFRANVVVDGDLEPFVEDGWSHVTIGDVRFRVSELCDRCPVPGIDPASQQVTAEPLRALARHRRRDGRTWFGVRLVPEGTGRLVVGDAATATSTP